VVTASEESAYDLIFMDLEMPVMDGFAASSTIRGARPGTRIVAVTANAAGDVRSRCFAVGMEAVLEKPVRLDDIRYAIAAPPRVLSAPLFPQPSPPLRSPVVSHVRGSSATAPVIKPPQLPTCPHPPAPTDRKKPQPPQLPMCPHPPVPTAEKPRGQCRSALLPKLFGVK